MSGEDEGGKEERINERRKMWKRKGPKKGKKRVPNTE